MSRHIIAPDWVIAGYQFPEDIKVTECDDLTELSSAQLNSADYLVIPYLQDHAEIIDALKKIHQPLVVQTLTAGFDNVKPYLPSGATLCNAAGVHDDSTSELAVTLTLNALRDLPRMFRGQQNQVWDQFFSKSLADKNVLLIGYGGVGKAVESRLLPFKCKVTPVATVARDHVKAITELPNLISDADVIILTVPLNDSTRGLVDRKFISKMKPGALLVNVARGPVVDTEALLAALSEGKICAALDVTDPEPLPSGHPLWTAPNCLITPHLGGEADVFTPRARSRIARQLDLWISGQPLECVVSP